MERSIDRVRIGTSSAIVTLSWDTAKELRERLALMVGTESLEQQFYAVGVSRAVVPTDEEKPLLLSILKDWIKGAHPDDVPTGIAVLHDALRADLGE